MWGEGEGKGEGEGRNQLVKELLGLHICYTWLYFFNIYLFGYVGS